MAKHNTPAKGTTAPAAPAAAAPQGTVNALLAQPLKVGKAYNVRPNTAQDNAATWQAICAALQAAPGNTLTRQQLHEVAAQRNHVPFVGYCMRRGYLVNA